ncbi:hypothetical protein V6N13_113663 [Hibiscus sabdariffa]
MTKATVSEQITTPSETRFSEQLVGCVDLAHDDNVDSNANGVNCATGDDVGLVSLPCVSIPSLTTENGVDNIEHNLVVTHSPRLLVDNVASTGVGNVVVCTNDDNDVVNTSSPPLEHTPNTVESVDVDTVSPSLSGRNESYK